MNEIKLNIDFGPLFTPFRINRLDLANRIVMAPMTREGSPGGVPGTDVAAYYRRRAEEDVGLILSEGTTIDHPAASPSPRVPNIHAPEALAGWRNVCNEVHEAGGKIAVQLWHVGALRQPNRVANPEVPPFSPSGVKLNGEKVGEPATEDEIVRVIDAYGRGAAAAAAVGFDGIEVHAAHCYCVDQFFYPLTNRRTDGWGGDWKGRVRFGVEIAKAIRRNIPTGMPLIFRFSQWKIGDYNARLFETPNDLEQFLLPLVDAGVDCFDASTRRFWIKEFEGSDLGLAGWTKKISGKPTMTVGSVTLSLEPTNSQLHPEPVVPFSVDQMVDLMRRFEAEEFDLVVVGRMLLSNPDWARLVRAGDIDSLKPFSLRYSRGPLI